MKPQNIKVTNSQIQNAKKADSHRCMIADALQKCRKDAAFIVVDAQAIRFSIIAERRRYIYLTPPRAQRALIAFDQGQPIKPFTFTMSTGYVTPIRKRSGKHTQKSTKRKSYMPHRTRQFGLRNV